MADEVMQFLVSGPKLKFQPGTQAQYSNSGYFLLTQIISSVSGLSFADFMNTNIFQPAGMETSYIYDQPEKFGANDALSRGNNELLYGKLWLAPGASSQVSSLNDFENFYFSLMSSQIISDKTFNLMIQPHSSGIFNRNYGYGFLINPSNRSEIGHEGLLGGFTPAMRIDLDKKWYVVVLNNGVGSGRSYAIMNIVSDHYASGSSPSLPEKDTQTTKNPVNCQ